MLTVSTAQTKHKSHDSGNSCNETAEIFPRFARLLKKNRLKDLETSKENSELGGGGAPCELVDLAFRLSFASRDATDTTLPRPFISDLSIASFITATSLHPMATVVLPRTFNVDNLPSAPQRFYPTINWVAIGRPSRHYER